MTAGPTNLSLLLSFLLVAGCPSSGTTRGPESGAVEGQLRGIRDGAEWQVGLERGFRVGDERGQIIGLRLEAGDPTNPPHTLLALRLPEGMAGRYQVGPDGPARVLLGLSGPWGNHHYQAAEGFVEMVPGAGDQLTLRLELQLEPPQAALWGDRFQLEGSCTGAFPIERFGQTP